MHEDDDQIWGGNGGRKKGRKDERNEEIKMKTEREKDTRRDHTESERT